MKKKLTVLLTCFSILFSNLCFAESKEVPAAKESSSAMEEKNWQPWAVAFVTIAIAAVGITLLVIDD
ncbi:MAG: hypothetical protein K1060chlam5_00043 [Candidatus Anoxychlamydiales bacterium]|nr:hypothetical protein [Candidatus Anoxychlamydiales bacterium]